MNKKLENTYNQISDVFSRAQIKQAVESLDNYRDRLKLIDTIIDRRQEIRQANDLQKITKYAHIFRRMIQRFRNKKEDQAAKQRHQLQMIMSMFAPKGNSSSPKNLSKIFSSDPHKRKIKEISDQRRDAVQFKVNRLTKQPFTDRKSNQYQHQHDELIQSNRTHRFLSAMNINEFQNEKELYLWDKNLDILEDQLFSGQSKNNKFLHIKKDIQSIQNKIQQNKILRAKINFVQPSKDQENILKQFSKQQLSLQRRQYKPNSQPQLPQNIDGNERQQNDYLLQAQLSQEGSSLLSFENKLQNLYQQTKEMKLKATKNLCQSQQLAKTNQEIITISKLKLGNINN